MENIVKRAGYMLTYALENLNINRLLHPFIVAIKDDNKEIKVEHKGISLEITIPKVINEYENNRHNALSATAIYPAEMINSRGKRESIIIVMIQDYVSKEYIVLSQPYTLNNGKLKVAKFELLDYSPFLMDNLKTLEEIFINGALSYESIEDIWSNKFIAS